MGKKSKSLFKQIKEEVKVWYIFLICVCFIIILFIFAFLLFYFYLPVIGPSGVSL